MTDKQQHLSFIQATITRMANMSLAIKSLTITLLAATITMVVALPKFYPLGLMAGLVPIIIFWHLDANYLRQEQLFRKLYDAVRKDEIKEKYIMNTKAFDKDVQSTMRLAFSWSVFWVYLIAMSALILTYFAAKT